MRAFLGSLFMACAALWAGAGPSPAALEASPRPAARPAAGQPAALPAVALAAGVAVSPRPAARPAPGPTTSTESHRVANTAFERWIDGFRPRAIRAGIAPEVYDRAFRGVRYNTSVIQKDRNQAEFTRQIWDYLDSAVSPTRVRNGREALRRHRQTLAAIERRYGVEAEVVTAVWGLESAYGAYKGDIPVIEALATLAHDGRRKRFFEDQLIAALRILQSGDTAPGSMRGSWAGAMGHTQFIPTSYLAYAQDFGGDGRRDIWGDDPADALASTAHYLAKAGWQKGQPWGVEVVLPRGFDFDRAGRRVKKSPSDWQRMGVRAATGGTIPDHGPASILLPAGARGAAFMIFDNFAAIERYNTADAYVIAVGHLSDRIAGGGPIRAEWPRDDRALSRNEKIEMQERLTRRGFDTRGAVRAFQRSQGMVPDGYTSFEVLRRLR